MFAIFNDNLVMYWCFTDPMLSSLCFNCICLQTKVDLHITLMNLYIGLVLVFCIVLFYDQFLVYIEPSQIALWHALYPKVVTIFGYLEYKEISISKDSWGIADCV